MSALLGLLTAQACVAQLPGPPARFWAAQWIDVPGAAPEAYGVYHFRRSFELQGRPRQFMVRVSADNRYELFVNGTRLSWGPARGDLTHWRYETVDIGPRLRAGKNLLAAVVWNDGPYRAIAQVSNQTGFVLEAEQPANAFVNTGKAWKCVEDRAYTPLVLPADQSTGYYALAANEKLRADLYPWGWQMNEYDDSAWPQAHAIGPAAPRDARDAPNRWMLVASNIPLEEQKQEQPLVLRQQQGVTVAGTKWRIPANSSAALLLDQRYLTTAYPEMRISGGRGAEITLGYAETLFVRKGGHGVAADKGNRDEIQGKQFYGPADSYLADGGRGRAYRPLSWRTFRYIQVRVKTAAQPLEIEDLRGVFTGYPFEKKASFEVDEPVENAGIQKILETGWRSARLCAHETYMDCPFYEQLQYAGDARIQMLVSIYSTGDTRLMKNGIGLLNSSRTAEGATYSRAPSYLRQYIPPFSLWWIGMVHDYWMYADDLPFVKEMLPGVRAVLDFYARYQKGNGSLLRMPWWNFVDWVKQWPNGEPPAEADRSSAAALDLQLLLAYQWAAELESALGSRALGGEDQALADKLKATILATDWDKERGLFADQPSHQTYSQQVNTLAVLAHVVTGDQGRRVMERVIADASLAQSSIYFRAYTNAALREVGLGGRYLQMLEPWREMLTHGLSTWAEWNGPDARSDCHAWGASPNFEFLRTVAGIEPLAPGFARVRVAPNPGALRKITARMPHPRGEIEVRLVRGASGKLAADIGLPAGVDGEFQWGGEKRTLDPGKNHLEIDSR
jgi:alpha-L-rhamnosidase